MLTTVVSHKYARAMFDESVERGLTQKVADDLQALMDLRGEDPAFLNFLNSPEVLTEHKTEFIRSVFGSRLDRLTTDFLHLLVEKGRINFLPEICRDFAHLTEEHQGLLRAQVTSAVPLDAEQEGRLARELARVTGKKVVLEKKVDPSILGGVVVHLGTKIVDRSLRRGLKELAHNLLHVEVN
jgi:F-type H+-transporting ATPase subunit delta